MRSFFAALFGTLLIGCAAEPPPSNTIQRTVEAPPPDPYTPELSYDNRYFDEAAQAAWRDQVNHDLEQIEALYQPDEYFVWTTHFRQGVDVWIGDATVWDLPTVAEPYPPSEWIFDGPNPSVGTATAFEDNDEEYKAGKYWLAIGRPDDARRCAVALEAEEEWAASATLAIHLDDQEMFTRGVEALTESDQLTRREQVLTIALDYNRIDWIRALGFEIPDLITDPDILAEAAMVVQDAELIAKLIAQDLEYWNTTATRYDHPGDRTVRLLVALGQIDAERARELAGAFLSSYEPELLFYRDEMNSTLYPIRGVFGLWELVREDPVLTKLYTDRVRAEFLDRYLFHPEEDRGHSEGEDPWHYMNAEWDEDCEMFGCNGQLKPNLLFTHVRRSRAHPGLAQMWRDIFDGLSLYCYGESLRTDTYDDHRRPVFVQQFGYALLGDAFDPDRSGLAADERYLLHVLYNDRDGGAFFLNETWEQYQQYGDNADALEHLLMLLTAGQIDDAHKAEILAQLKVRHPGEYETFLVKADQDHFRSFVLFVFNRELQGWDAAHEALVSNLMAPIEVAAANQAAHEERNAHGLRKPQANLLDTEAEATALVESVLEDVSTRAPWGYARFGLVAPGHFQADDAANKDPVPEP